MATTLKTLERDFFRTINRFVEPAVQKGVLSPRCAPTGLILLESTGYKSGVKRKTPLLASHLGDYTIVSTFRGDKSFWLKNLQKEPDISIYRGGKAQSATSLVVTDQSDESVLAELPGGLAWLLKKAAAAAPANWAFAVLQRQG